MNDFHYALSLLNTLYDIDLEEDTFEEIALVGWNLIGNKRTKLNRYQTTVTNCHEGVQLPCGVDDIEAVTTGFEEWAYSTNDTVNGDSNSAFIEAYIEYRKKFKNPLYAPGKFIKYEQVGDMLYFDKPYGKINILYRSELADENGLPQITDKEARALATYCAYIVKYKEGLKTNNPQIIQIANTLKQNWDVQCDQARTCKLSQNQWDEVLDARVSHNRKQFNHSYKMYQ